MAASDNYTDYINQLLKKPMKDLTDYGTPETTVDVPDWLQNQSEVGLGKATEQAMYRLGIYNSAGNYQDTLRDLVKNEGQTGIAGGFTDELSTRAGEQFVTQEANLAFDINRKSDRAKTQALSQMLNLEQFNKEMTFNYQTAMASQELQRRQMQLQALISGRDYELQKELADDQSWLDTAFNVANLAMLII